MENPIPCDGVSLWGKNWHYDVCQIYQLAQAIIVSAAITSDLRNDTQEMSRGNAQGD